MAKFVLNGNSFDVKPGESISIVNGDIFIGGRIVEPVDSNAKVFNITIEGDVDKLEGEFNTLQITGDVDRVTTTNGSVTVNGGVNRVKTTNGSVKIGGDAGDVYTVNGSVARWR